MGVELSQTKISIHAPREGSDLFPALLILVMFIFQSTLPVRGATCIPCPVRDDILFQSTLPVRGATLLVLLCQDLRLISIHAPREGSDDLGARPG